MRQHGLIQAFSSKNLILNSIKTIGNIVCFRDLKEETDDAIELFGDRDAKGVVLLKTFGEYYNGYEEKENHIKEYIELIEEIKNKYPLGKEIIGEKLKKVSSNYME